MWADYFDAQGVQYAFFSAANAVAIQQARQEALEREEAEARALSSTEDPHSEPEEAEDNSESPDPSDDEDDDEDESSEYDTEDDVYFSAEEDTEDGQDARTRVLSVLELEELFMHSAPDLSGTLLISQFRSNSCFEFA